MQQVDTKIEVGSRLVFCGYADAYRMVPEDHIFPVGAYLVVGAVNEDGGLQCFETDEIGTVTSIDGDTVFPEEVCHLTYAGTLPVFLR